MNDEQFQQKLNELTQEISALPIEEQEKLQKLAAETRVRHKNIKEAVSGLQESIDFLRLSIKYILFDLEATRRENEYLRQMLNTYDKDEEDMVG